MTSASANTSAARGFLWQGLLILLPVAILAVVGLYSLRQDRLLAEADARQTAQRHADEVSRVIWTRLRSMTRLEDPLCLSFRIDAQGRLLFPPPAPTLPTPQPVDPSVLGTERAAWWRTVFSLATDAAERAVALDAARRLLASKPPAAFAGPVQYRLGSLLADEGHIADAIRELGKIASTFPDAMAESGLPLQPLAEFRQFELMGQREPIALDKLCSNLVHQPTFLTPYLLERTLELARSNRSNDQLTNLPAAWRVEWDRHNAIRALATQALTSLDRAGKPGNAQTNDIPPTLFWLGSSTETPLRGQEVLTSPSRSQPVPRVIWNRPSVHNKAGEADPSDSSASSVVSADRSQEFRVRAVRDLLATRIDPGDGSHWIVCQALGMFTSEGYIDVNPASDFWSELERSFPTPPPWLGISLEMAGRTVISDRRLLTIALRPSGKGAGQTWTPIATLAPPEILATSRQTEAGASSKELLRVDVHLVSPEMLYDRQQARTRLFGLLIGVSALASIVGFVSARRAFHRQQRLAEMKSNFVSSVSHELRAPIASVRLMAESLERGTVAEPARQRDYFRFIVQECRRLGTLIENVLDFARIEQGRKQYEPEPTDVAALIRQTVRLMEPAAAEKKVVLVTDLPEAIAAREPAPMLDPQAIQQALVNLIDNAVKHSPAGGKVTVSAEIGLSAGGADGSSLRLHVEDVGPGIPPEDHERIFERFYRRGSELRRDTQGVGIGLSIVKHIVEAHGGRIFVRSEPGRGCRFTIELPLEPGRAAPSTPQ